MAETETVPMEEAGMLSSLMDEANEPAEIEQPNRDELGRFAPKVEQVEAAPVVDAAPPPEPEAKDDGQVPSWRLRELREARDAAEQKAQLAGQERYALEQRFQNMQRELATLKAPKPEPVDFFQNPDEALNQRIAPIQSDFEQAKFDMRMEFSRELLVVKHGEEPVAEMEKAIAQAMASNHPDMPLLSAQVRQAKNPAKAAMDWYQRSKLVEATGGDLTKYRERLQDELLKDPAFQAKVLEATRAQVGQQAAPNIKLPPSLNKATGAGISNTEPDDNDASDGALFRHAMAGSRRR